MGDFGKLLDLKRESVLLFDDGRNRLMLCPDMGGRIFAEIDGACPHRIDLEAAANPGESFNNYGGANFWPAPEGGKFGFNYREDEWYVQPAINNQPFVVEDLDESAATIEKEVDLANRAGSIVKAVMRRQLDMAELPEVLAGYGLRAWVSYRTTDSFDVRNRISDEEALIAAWTLEQFDASGDTVAFCAVENPKDSINFDFYEQPHDRISYFDKGFTYKTDCGKAGQIGIRKDSAPWLIGFVDMPRRLLCVRENLNAGEGVYFNIADNDQAGGPYSAADTYSIYNSDPEMAAFELETVGSVQIENGLLKSSLLVSRTTLAVFEKTEDIERFLTSNIGGNEWAI